MKAGVWIASFARQSLRAALCREDAYEARITAQLHADAGFKGEGQGLG